MWTQSFLVWDPPVDLRSVVSTWEALENGRQRKRTDLRGTGIYKVMKGSGLEVISYFQADPANPNVLNSPDFRNLTWVVDTQHGHLNCTIDHEKMIFSGRVLKLACSFEAGTLPYGYQKGDGSAFKYQLLEKIYLKSGAIEAYGWNQKYPPDPDAPDFFGGKAFQFSMRDNQRLIVPFEEERDPTKEELVNWDKWQIVVPPDDTGGRSYRGV